MEHWLQQSAVQRELMSPFHGVPFAALRAAMARVVRQEVVERLRRDAIQAVAERWGTPPEEPVAVRAWAARAGVQAWLELPSGLAEADPGLDDDGVRYLALRGGLTLLQVLATEPEPSGWRSSSAKAPLSVHAALRRSLVEAAADRQIAVEDHEGRREPGLPDPGRPRLRAAAAELLTLYEAGVEQLGPPWHLASAVDHDLQVHTDPPRLLWRRAAGAPVGVRVDLSPVGVKGGSPHWQGRPIGPLRLAALAHVLRWLEEGLDGELKDRLEADLATPAWQRFLDQLEPLLSPPDEIAFELRQDADGWWLAVLACELGSKGQLKMRTLGLGDLDPAASRTPQEAEALAALTGRHEGGGLRPGEWKRLQHEPARIAPALAALRGHPRLFIKHGKRRDLHVRLAGVGLKIEREGERVQLVPTLGGRPASHRELVQIRMHEGSDTPAMLLDADAGFVTLTRVDGRVRALLELLQSRGSSFEAEAAEPLLSHLAGLEGILPISLDGGLAGVRVEQDSRSVVRLELADGLLGVRVWARPLAEGRTLVPGEGADAAYGLRDEERVHAARDLASERARASALAVELGLDDAEPDGPYGWWVQDPEVAARLVLSLKDRPDAVTEWVGRRARVRTSPGLDRLAIRFRSLGAWFGVEGSLGVSKGSEVDLAALLEAAEQGRSYVALGPGDWLELSGELLEALAPLSAAVRAAGGSAGARIAGVHAAALDALREGGAQLDAPAEWLNLLDRVDAAAGSMPEPPAELASTLRPYQVDGFRWAARLAGWAGGAVLADDMGLGKTVQALAVLLHRRDEGPALVVAPASVVFNWMREAERFAPSLRFTEHRGQGRTERLASLGPGDVVATTWSLLARDIDALEGLEWGTVVLDEAQAIKNMATRRNKAARRLRAGFRLALTGTPVENHAGELHALMTALVPGLLGSTNTFRDRFLRPIAEGDESARSTLAALVAPFVLRRLKAQVAAELPPRTEVELGIVLTPAERAVYDKVREAGLAELKLATVLDDNKRRFTALGLLTRLRQAACHPRLVAPESTVPSSKTREAVELLDELRAEGHAALVFSQFVGHLQLVKAALEAEGFRIAYLDGSTPNARRRQEVDRFQAGEADVFLISLKAGGTGLNLTAATYVLHLDPWWNPAVEDQATDRAHRIGQDRPVTVYRLLARDTVEETIVQMHADKRELADQLLAGAASSRALSADELTRLIVGQG